MGDRILLRVLIRSSLLAVLVIGLLVRGAPRKAATRESERMRYLPSFTDDMEYMTTKNASRSVMRSP